MIFGLKIFKLNWLRVYVYLDLDTGESRLLGLVMIPGRHIISIHTDVQQTIEHFKNSSNYEQLL